MITFRVVHAIPASRLRHVACDLCGLDDPAPVTRENGFSIVRCRGCGFLYLDPILPDDYLDHMYQEMVFDDREAVLRHGLRLLAERGAGGDLLDVGCGPGQFLAMARAAGWRVAGVELSAGAAERARAVSEWVWAGDFTALDLPESAYDVVTMWDVLEHIPAPSRVLARAAAVLRPGGRLLVHCPNGSLVVPLARVQRRLKGEQFVGLDTPAHVSHFTARTLGAFLARAGFEVEGFFLSDVTPGGHVPYWAKRAYMGAARLVYRLSGLNVANNLLALARRRGAVL